jgi:hypothetical protein
MAATLAALGDPTMSDSAAAPAASLGVFARASGVVFSPGATFRDVVRDPRPAQILFLVCLVVALATGIPQMTERGRQAALDMQVQQVERFSGRPVTPEVYAQMERRAPYTAYIAMGSIFVALPVFSMLFAAIYWAAFNTVLGGTASFRQVLSIVTHAQVISAIGAALAAPVVYLQGVQSTFGPFTLGALFPMLEPGTPLANLLSTLSVFQLWSLIVTAIGLGVLYHRKARTIGMVLLVVYVAVMAGISSLPALISR